jgi:site-specific DNA-methyltransferase (adenine-specific)
VAGLAGGVLLFELRLGDALELLASLDTASVDALITDPPYGNTELAWDDSVNWPAFWQEARRVCKPDASVVLFACGRFTFELFATNPREFRYRMTWRKSTPTGFLDAPWRPLRVSEDILVFNRAAKGSIFNPQRLPATNVQSAGVRRRQHRAEHYSAHGTGKTWVEDGTRHPTDILDFPSPRRQDQVHPTQKPLDLMRFLVRTYSNAGGLVLDPYAGSGTTAVAAQLDGRRFIGSERDPAYHAVAVGRLAGAACQPDLFEGAAA